MNSLTQAGINYREYLDSPSQNAGQHLANTYRNSINSLKKRALTTKQKQLVQSIEHVCGMFPSQGGRRTRRKRKATTRRSRR